MRHASCGWGGGGLSFEGGVRLRRGWARVFYSPVTGVGVHGSIGAARRMRPPPLAGVPTPSSMHDKWLLSYSGLFRAHLPFFFSQFL